MQTTKRIESNRTNCEGELLGRAIRRRRYIREKRRGADGGAEAGEDQLRRRLQPPQPVRQGEEKHRQFGARIRYPTARR